MPTRVTLLLPLNTGPPLSPERTRAETRFWQSCMISLPVTSMFTHVFVTLPVVQPEVRPTFPVVWPTEARPSAVMLKLPLIVTEPLLGPVVYAIFPRLEVVVDAYAARDASLNRQRKPTGHPVLFGE